MLGTLIVAVCALLLALLGSLLVLPMGDDFVLPRMHGPADGETERETGSDERLR